MSRPDIQVLEQYHRLSAKEKAELHLRHQAWGWQWWTTEALHFARFTLEDLAELVELVDKKRSRR